METEEQSHLEGLCADISPNHREFADQFMLDFNGTQALMRCRGFDCTVATAGSMAPNLLQREDVQAYLRLRLAQLSAEVGLSVARIIQRLEDLAFSNIDDYIEQNYDGQIRLKPWRNISKRKKAAVKKVKIYRTTNSQGDEEYREEIEMKDDLAALKVLFVYMGLDNKLETAQRTIKRLKSTNDL